MRGTLGLCCRGYHQDSHKGFIIINVGVGVLSNNILAAPNMIIGS